MYTLEEITPLPDNQKFSDDFHTFSIEWAPGEIKWFVDGNLYATKNDWFSKSSNESVDYPYPAPFDRDFHLRLNLAVGGDWPGNPDATTEWSNRNKCLLIMSEYTAIPDNIRNLVPVRAKTWAAAGLG